MSLLSELQIQLEEIQAKIAFLQSTPEDIYNLGTVALFVSNNNTKKWYYVKIAEETWQKTNGGEPRSLSEWILKASGTETYFEVYIMAPGETPIYASA